jgi:hypothetical protein
MLQAYENEEEHADGVHWNTATEYISLLGTGRTDFIEIRVLSFERPQK